MIIDELLEFCDATSLNTGGAGGYLIGSAVDLGVTGRAIGAGQPLYLVITVDTTVTSDGSATVAFELRSDATATVDEATGTFHFSTGAIPKASLVAGTILVFPIPQLGWTTYERYLAIIQRTAVAALTAGKINAFLTIDPAGWVPYAEGNN